MGEPLQQFKKYWRLAHRRKDPTADYLSLATVDRKARPHVRTVLIKTMDQKGIGFVTNAKGPKVMQMKRHFVEGCAAWPKLSLQVRFSGRVKLMPKRILQRLWSKRPRKAQVLYHLGIPQSGPIPSYSYLLRKEEALEKKWRDKKKIPLSKWYIGFIIKPKTIEFLFHNLSRLNKREHYKRTSRGWIKTILAP